MSCLFDNSNKKLGKINYYDRENNIWYNQKIGENIKLIAKKKFVKPNDYFILSNKETVSTRTRDDTLIIRFGKKTVMTVIFNAYIKIDDRSSVGFGISSYDISGNWDGQGISGLEGVKKYDGSYTYTIDVRDQFYTNSIEIQKWWGNENTILNSLTLEFEEKYIFFDYNSYIKNFS